MITRTARPWTNWEAVLIRMFDRRLKIFENLNHSPAWICGGVALGSPSVRALRRRTDEFVRALRQGGRWGMNEPIKHVVDVDGKRVPVYCAGCGRAMNEREYLAGCDRCGLKGQEK